MAKPSTIVPIALACASLLFGFVPNPFAAQQGTSIAFAQEPNWQTYASADAAYQVDYPTGSVLNVSQDASQRFKIVYIQFPVTDTEAYQGASILVLENPADLGIRDLIQSRYAVSGEKSSTAMGRATNLTLGDIPAVKLERDSVIGDHDKYTILVAGNPGRKIAYRINLHGGGKGGDTEPSLQTQAIFDHL